MITTYCTSTKYKHDIPRCKKKIIKCTKIFSKFNNIVEHLIITMKHVYQTLRKLKFISKQEFHEFKCPAWLVFGLVENT